MALLAPVNGPITGRFGDPRANGAHTGIDFGVRVGTPVRSPAAGSVRDVWWNLGGGRMVAVRHTDGSESRFAHLSSAAVRTGQGVAAGQLIAYSGATGTMVTGAHLHYELHIGGRPVDPLPYLTGAATIGTGNPDKAPTGLDVIAGIPGGVVDTVTGIPGAALDAAVQGLAPVAINAAWIVAAVAIGWGGIRRILDG